MKILYYVTGGLTALILLSLIALSVRSRFEGSHGLVDGWLAKCPETPNCICKEPYVNQNFQPLPLDLENAASAWADLKSAVIDAGGEIHEDQPYYLWATFVTPLFRFVDDFEARLDSGRACIQLRSASRVGSYDYDTNLKRIQKVVENYKRKRDKGKG